MMKEEKDLLFLDLCSGTVINTTYRCERKRSKKNFITGLARVLCTLFKPVTPFVAPRYFVRNGSFNRSSQQR
jgi:hypothetical protein